MRRVWSIKSVWIWPLRELRQPVDVSCCGSSLRTLRNAPWTCLGRPWSGLGISCLSWNRVGLPSPSRAAPACLPSCSYRAFWLCFCQRSPAFASGEKWRGSSCPWNVRQQSWVRLSSLHPSLSPLPSLALEFCEWCPNSSGGDVWRQF